MWAGLSAADVVRRIYDHLAVDGWSCVRIATEFNSLGVPTSYRRDGRGVRGNAPRASGARVASATSSSTPSTGDSSSTAAGLPDPTVVR